MTRRLAAVVLAGAVLVVGLAACGRDAATPAEQPQTSRSGDSGLGLTIFEPDERAAAPDLAGITVEGGYLDLNSLRGKVVVLNAWASWCEPCKEELPVLATLASSAGPEVAFVGLDVNDSSDDAVAMSTQYGITYPSISDRGGLLLGTIPGVPPGAIPSTIVIDRQGRVAARVIGRVKPGDLDPVLADLLREGASS